MIKCPNCQATLPTGSVSCQFCNTQFGPTPAAGRSARSGTAMSRAGGTKWEVKAYNAISVWWIIEGAWAIQRGLMAKDGPAIITIVIGVATAMVAIGLLARVEAARGVVNVLCFIQILDAGFGLIGGFFLTGILGIFGAIIMILNIIRLFTAGLMIYLIGETD